MRSAPDAGGWPDHLKEYKKSSSREKLEWLAEAKDLIRLTHPGKKLDRFLKIREILSSFPSSRQR